MGNYFNFYELLIEDIIMKVSIDKELLTRFARGECTRAEQEQVKAFLEQPEWKQALEELLNDDFETFSHTPYTETDNTAWNQHFRENYAGRNVVRPVWDLRWISYAAACILIIGGCYWFFNMYQNSGSAVQQQLAMLSKTNPKGQRSIITLPDSTVVYLGAASSLRYPEQFGSGNREVLLEGEAWFEVANDQQHPFTIQTGMIQTKVLGTTFKIDAFKDVTVSVATGKVQVAKRDSALAILTPGRQVTWNAQTGEINLVDIDAEEITAWKEGKVTFANTSLAEIAETLERWYNVDIRFKDEQIAQTKLSIILRSTVTLQHSLDIICNTLHLKYTLDGKTIMIKP